MDQTILKQNMEKSKQALLELYKLREVNKYFYDSYCLPAVAMLEHISRFKG